MVFLKRYVNRTRHVQPVQNSILFHRIERRDVSMISNIGIPGLILILVLALIIFGPKKLPELGRAVGQTLREFKNSTRDLIDDEKEKSEKIVESTEGTETLINRQK